MVKSMTGYGREAVNIDNTTITIEIRSVNHRFLDFSLKAPSTLLFLEEKLKNLIKSNFVRGRIEVYIKIDGDNFIEKQLSVDWDLMDQYIHHIKKTQERYQLSDGIPTTLLSTIPDLFSVQEIDEQPSQLSDAILQCTKKVCKQVLSRREQEGNFLLGDINNRMKMIIDIVKMIEERKCIVKKEYQLKVQSRIEDQIRGIISIEDTRLIPEIALLAEKGDITEEITRLESHIEHFYKIIDKDESIGRTLDFIIQEMQRETNTIGAKSVDSKISEWIVDLKGEIEKIREQTQNIE